MDKQTQCRNRANAIAKRPCPKCIAPSQNCRGVSPVALRKSAEKAAALSKPQSQAMTLIAGLAWRCNRFARSVLRSAT